MPGPRTLSPIPPEQRHRGRASLRLGLVILACLLVVLFLTESVFRRGGFAWDQAILDWYRVRRTPFWTAGAEAIALIGGLKVLPWITALLCGLLLLLRRLPAALFLALSVYGAILINISAKVVFQRPRPDELGAVLAEPGFSFPSGHAMSNAAFGFALALIFRDSAWRWPAAVLGVGWGLLVAASRNYLGVHYPTDVTVGVLTSLAWVLGLAVVFRRFTVREVTPDTVTH